MTEPADHVRQILIRHLSSADIVRMAFPERIRALLIELDPYIGPPDPTHPDVRLPRLRERELDALRHIANGATYEDLCRHLGAPIGTVRSLIHRLMPKLGARTSAQAVAYALRKGLIR